MHITSAKDVASLIKEQRLSQGWTQAELAKRAGVSRDWLIGLEKAKPSVELALVLRTLKALGLQLDAARPAPSTSITSRYLQSLRSDNPIQEHE